MITYTLSLRKVKLISELLEHAAQSSIRKVETGKKLFALRSKIIPFTGLLTDDLFTKIRVQQAYTAHMRAIKEDTFDKILKTQRRYNMTHNVELQTEEVALILQAIEHRVNRLKANAAMTRNSGYGSAKTEEKAEKMEAEINRFNDVATLIANQTLE